MFERVKYKKLAKVQLKGRKTTAVLAALVSIIIFGALNYTPDIKRNSVTDTGYARTVDYRYDAPSFREFNYEFNSSQAAPYDLLFTLIKLAASGVVSLALCHLFNQYTKTTDKISFSEFLKGFNLWIKGALGSLWFMLWVTLWSLLFIIPGIVKFFAYSQIFFIIAENPSIGITKALRLSKAMTKGFKGDLFVMGLSFLGWHLLSILTLGILELWILPYEYLAFVNAYKDIKYQAIRTGVLSIEDFN